MMKEFQPLRYIRRFAAWMLIFVLIGLMGSYYVLQKAQKYTALTTLTFHDTQMEENLLNPDGTEFDPSEIRSADVVRAAMEKLDTDYTMEEIRSAITVEEVIPEDIEAIRNGAWEDGLEYIYYPTSYTITCTLKTKDVATILNAVVDSYLSYYEDTHMAYMRVPESIVSINDDDYDYIEYVEALDAYFDNNLAFLENAATYWSDYRCTSTGYSFEALRKVYQYEADYSLTELYTQIISGEVTKKADLLIDRYTNRKSDNNLSIAEYQRSIAQYERLIETYTQKRMDSYEYWENSNTSSADEMLDEVYTIDNESASYRTVYDDWLECCVNLRKAISALEADNVYCDYVLEAFEGAGNATEEKASQVQGIIDTIYAKMVSMDKIVTATYSAYCDYAIAQSVTMDDTPFASNKYNIKLYMVLAGMLLIAASVVLAIVIGRLLDFGDYYGFSMDSTNSKPKKKVRKDAYAALISEYAKANLPIPFALMVFESDGDNDDEFEKILVNGIGEQGKIARSDNGRFFCFMEKGNSLLAVAMTDKISKAAREQKITFRSAFSVNSWAHLVDIAELVRETENKLMQESVEIV